MSFEEKLSVLIVLFYLFSLYKGKTRSIEQFCIPKHNLNVSFHHTFFFLFLCHFVCSFFFYSIVERHCKVSLWSTNSLECLKTCSDNTAECKTLLFRHVLRICFVHPPSYTFASLLRFLSL